MTIPVTTAQLLLKQLGTIIADFDILLRTLPGVLALPGPRIPVSAKV